MRLADGEPDLGPWTSRPARAVAEDLVVRVGGHRTESGRSGPLVVAVDGRSGSGKSTIAALLVAHIPGSCVVHTDDLAWNDDVTAWADLLVGGVLHPAARGEAVAYRPPAWEREGRDGAVTVPAGTHLLLVEGVAASRQSLASHLDAAMWVQSDQDEAYRRGIARDVQAGRTPQEAADFWTQWCAVEDPFLLTDRPWERADVVVCGTPLATGTFPPPGAMLVGEAARRTV